jgi:hypothetical protein
MGIAGSVVRFWLVGKQGRQSASSPLDLQRSLDAIAIRSCSATIRLRRHTTTAGIRDAPA